MNKNSKSKNGVNNGCGDDEDRKMRKLFVDKLNASITEEDIYAVFSKHGEIEEVAKYQDRRAPHRYFAFVVYKHAKDCVKATYDPCPVIKGRQCACMLAAIGKPFSGYKFFVQKNLLTDDGSEAQHNNNNGHHHHNHNHHSKSNNHHKLNNNNHSRNNNGKKNRQRRPKKNKNNKNNNNNNGGGNNHHHSNNNNNNNNNHNHSHSHNHNQQGGGHHMNMNMNSQPVLSKIDMNLHSQQPTFQDENLSSCSAIMHNNTAFEESSPVIMDTNPTLQYHFDSQNSHASVGSIEPTPNGVCSANMSNMSHMNNMNNMNNINGNINTMGNAPQMRTSHSFTPINRNEPPFPRFMGSANSYTQHTRRDYISPRTNNSYNTNNGNNNSQPPQAYGPGLDRFGSHSYNMQLTNSRARSHSHSGCAMNYNHSSSPPSSHAYNNSNMYAPQQAAAAAAPGMPQAPHSMNAYYSNPPSMSAGMQSPMAVAQKQGPPSMQMRQSQPTPVTPQPPRHQHAYSNNQAQARVQSMTPYFPQCPPPHAPQSASYQYPQRQQVPQPHVHRIAASQFPATPQPQPRAVPRPPSSSYSLSPQIQPTRVPMQQQQQFPSTNNVDMSSPVPPITHSASYSVIERSKSYPVGNTSASTNSASNNAPNLPSIRLMEPQMVKTPNPKLSASSSAVQLYAMNHRPEANQPQTPQPQPVSMLRRSHSARSTFPYARGPALQSSRSAHNVFVRLPAEDAMGTKKREEVMIDDGNIPSPDLLADDIFMDMQLSPSPPPNIPPPLHLNMGSKPSIIIDEDPIDMPVPRQFATVEDAKKASDKELEAGFTMLETPTDSEGNEYDVEDLDD